jgi:copper resistance protein B
MPAKQGSDGAEDDVGGSAGMTDDAAMDMRSMQGGSAPPDARDPHAYADGQDFGPYSLRLGDMHSLGSLLADNFEVVRSDDNSFAAYDLQAWYGRTYDRAVLKAEGDIDNREFQDARSELLWGHAIAAFWDTQLGARYDSGDGPNRSWLAFGVQGLAPYWFEVEATGYVGEGGRTALRLDVSYDLLVTQKLILQPRIEANAYGKSDPGRGLGSGLADLTAQLRLRYEIRRRFAPYVGVEWAGKFGSTEDLARAAGEDVNGARFVAGLRFWF